MNTNNRFFKCECGTHTLETEYDDELNQYNFTIWHYGHQGDVPMSFKERVRWCWRILTTGNPWADAVILSEKNKVELVNYLNNKGKSEKKTLLG